MHSKKKPARKQKDGVYIDQFGYHHAVLYNDKNELVDNYLHELVALTFVPNPNNFKKVKHIDSNKNNNSAANLQWVKDFSYTN